MFDPFTQNKMQVTWVFKSVITFYVFYFASLKIFFSSFFCAFFELIFFFSGSSANPLVQSFIVG